MTHTSEERGVTWLFEPLTMKDGERKFSCIWRAFRGEAGPEARRTTHDEPELDSTVSMLEDRQDHDGRKTLVALVDQSSTTSLRVREDLLHKACQRPL